MLFWGVTHRIVELKMEVRPQGLNTVAEVLREQYSELYRALVNTDTSRRLVATDLYSKNIVSQHEHCKIKQLEKSHDAELATDEILKIIETHLKYFPTNISKVLEVLGREEVLVPIVTSMKMNLPPVSGPAVCSETISSVASPQSLVPTEHDGRKGKILIKLQYLLLYN